MSETQKTSSGILNTGRLLIAMPKDSRASMVGIAPRPSPDII